MATIESHHSKTVWRHPVIKKMSLTSGNEVTTLFMKEDTNQAWNFTRSTTHSTHTITMYNENKISIKARGVEVILKYIHKKNKVIYTLQLKLDPSLTYKGMIGDFLNLPTRKLKKLKARKVPSKCRKINADYSKSLKNKEAARYKI